MKQDASSPASGAEGSRSRPAAISAAIVATPADRKISISALPIPPAATRAPELHAGVFANASQ
jgi:hypothetical protein